MADPSRRYTVFRSSEEAKLEVKQLGDAKSYAESYEQRGATRGFLAPSAWESVTQIRVGEDAVHAVQPGNMKTASVCG